MVVSSRSVPISSIVRFPLSSNLSSRRSPPLSSAPASAPTPRPSSPLLAHALSATLPPRLCPVLMSRIPSLPTLCRASISTPASPSWEAPTLTPFVCSLCLLLSNSADVNLLKLLLCIFIFAVHALQVREASQHDPLRSARFFRQHFLLHLHKLYSVSYRSSKYYFVTYVSLISRVSKLNLNVPTRSRQCPGTPQHYSRHNICTEIQFGGF